MFEDLRLNSNIFLQDLLEVQHQLDGLLLAGDEFSDLRVLTGVHSATLLQGLTVVIVTAGSMIQSEKHLRTSVRIQLYHGQTVKHDRDST